jgi:thymidylate synthase ThyX
MTLNPAENYSAKEQQILQNYFTNVDKPVFALKNLPEAVKGALFARYSRSSKPLRRLFLDEFLPDLNDVLPTNDNNLVYKQPLEKANEFYQRVLADYGDDSIAQLGGAHLACEGVSQLLTKQLEHSRLMSYLEQSTRYLAYDKRDSLGRYKYYRDPEILSSSLGAKYVGIMDRIFDTYSELTNKIRQSLERKYIKNAKVENVALARAIKAKAFDITRGLLPVATLSNLGIFGSGQSFELLLIKLANSQLNEAKTIRSLMLDELDKVIGPFLRRVEQPDKGVLWSQYLNDTKHTVSNLVSEYLTVKNSFSRPYARLVWFDSQAIEKIIASIIFEQSGCDLLKALEIAHNLPQDKKAEFIKTYAGNRLNRRHKPQRAFEAANYCFEIVSDYGAFRDLQRHRMLTVIWDKIDPELGYYIPDEIIENKLENQYKHALALSFDLYCAIQRQFPHLAQYALCLAFHIRYQIILNAREAMHIIELRSQPQGHPSYRKIAADMKNELVRIGHAEIADCMTFFSDDHPELERLDAEIKRAHKLKTTAHEA